jgi:hypothetical protein
MIGVITDQQLLKRALLVASRKAHTKIAILLFICIPFTPAEFQIMVRLEIVRPSNCCVFLIKRKYQKPGEYRNGWE